MENPTNSPISGVLRSVDRFSMIAHSNHESPRIRCRVPRLTSVAVLPRSLPARKGNAPLVRSNCPTNAVRGLNENT